MGFQGHCIAVIAGPGTGKTTWMDKLVVASPRNALWLVSDDDEELLDKYPEVPDPDRFGSFNGKCKYILPDTNKDTLKTLWSAVRFKFGTGDGSGDGGIVAIDDAATILGTREQPVIEAFTKRRNARLDIIMNCHGAKEVPVSLIPKMTHFIIGQIMESTRSIEQRLGGHAAKHFRAAVEYVNDKAQTNPFYKIEFPLKGQVLTFDSNGEPEREPVVV